MTRFFALSHREVHWVAGCALVLALVSADVVSGGLLSHVDSVVRDWIQPRASNAPAWMGMPGDLGEVGIAAGLLVAACLVTAQVTWRAWPLALGAGNLVAVELAVLVLKGLIGRPGPSTEPDRPGYPGYFPSGHTATSAVCAGTVVFLVLTWGSTHRLSQASLAGQGAGLAVGAVSGAQAALEDHHWISDGIGGLLLASIVLTLGFAAARRYVARTPRPGP